MSTGKVHNPSISKKLEIEHFIVNYNLSEHLQKFLRETFRQLFEAKSKSLYRHKRTPVFILNTSKTGLRQVLRMNKNPDVVLFSISEVHYKIINPNPCLKHPDLKEILHCHQRNELENSILVWIGDLSEQFAWIVRNGIQMEFTVQLDNGQHDTILVDGQNDIERVMPLLEKLVCITIGNLTFNAVINLNLESRPSYPDRTIYITFERIWDYYQEQFNSTRKSYHHEKAQLLKLRKFAIILPPFFTDILNNTLKVDNIKNVDRFESLEIFSERGTTVPIDKIIRYLVKTEFREIPVYFDERAQSKIYSILLGNSVYSALGEIGKSIFRLTKSLRESDMEMMIESIPEQVVGKLANINTDPLKLIEGKKSDAIKKIFTSLSHNYPIKILLDKLDSLSFECMSKSLEPFIYALSIPFSPKDQKLRISRALAVGLPTDREFISLPTERKVGFLEKIYSRKADLDKLHQRNGFLGTLGKSRVIDYIAELIKLNPPSLYNDIDLDTSVRLLRSIVKIDRAILGVAISEAKKRVYLQANARDIIMSICSKFTNFLSTLKSDKLEHTATVWLKVLSGDEDSLQKLVKSAINDERSWQMKLQHLYTFFKKEDNLHFRSVLQSHTTMISNDYDCVICMEVDKPQLEKILLGTRTSIVSLTNEYKNSEFSQYFSNKFNNIQNEDVLSVITDIIEKKLAEIPNNSDDPVEEYLNKSIVIILRIISALVSGQDISKMMKECDEREEMRGRIEGSLKKNLLTLFKRRNKNLLLISQFNKQLEQLQEKEVSVKSKVSDFQSYTDKLGKAIEEGVQVRSESFKILSGIVNKQRTFTYNFVRTLRSFLFPENPCHERVGQDDKIINFTQAEIEYLTTQGLYFVSYSVQFRSFLDFCIEKDNLPPEIFPIGDHVDIPEHCKKVVVGPDVEYKIQEKLKQLFKQSNLLFLEQKNYELLLYFNEKDKRAYRKKYLAYKQNTEKLIQKSNRAHLKYDELMDVLGKISKMLFDIFGKSRQPKERNEKHTT